MYLMLHLLKSKYMVSTKGISGEARVILAVFKDQKEIHRILKNDGTYGELFMGRSEWSFNGWDGATLGRALHDQDEIKKGDYIISAYMAYKDDAAQLKTTDLIKYEIEMDDREEAYSVPYDMCYFKVTDSGFECIGPNMICSRVYEPENKLSIGNKKQIKNVVRIDQMTNYPDNYFVTDEYKRGKPVKEGVCMNSVKPGDIIIVKPYSDVEVKYTWNGQHRSIIRVNFERNFAGAKIDNLVYQL